MLEAAINDVLNLIEDEKPVNEVLMPDPNNIPPDVRQLIEGEPTYDDVTSVLGYMNEDLGADMTDNIKDDIRDWMKYVEYRFAHLLSGKSIQQIIEDDVQKVNVTHGKNKVKVVEDRNIINKRGEPGAAAYDRKNNLIRVNSLLVQEKFDNKAWRNNANATALLDELFPTFESWKNFVMEHEYQHSLLPQKEGETARAYEDRINKAAILAMSIETLNKPVETGLPVKDDRRDKEYFKEHGMLYKFTFKNGNFVKGEYDPGGMGNWQPLNVKKQYAKYLTLKEASKQRALKEEAQPVKDIKPELMADENQLLLPSGKMITFNEQQATALEEINKWLESDDLFFTLSGFAGTGKTTIILKTLETTLKDKRVAVSAPPHKAKKVVGKTTKRSAETIHALLALKPNLEAADVNPNNVDFQRDRSKTPKIGGFHVVVIDEASMLNKTMMKEIMTQATNKNVKVLFMGDRGQIPPIGETESDAFNPTMIPSVHLDKVERQEDGNPLFKVYDAIRKDQTTHNDQFDHVTDLNDKGEGIEFTPYANVFVDEMIKAFTSEEFKTNKEHAKVLAYTNAKVKEYNMLVRRAVMGKDVSYMEVGDLLTGYTSIANGLDMALETSADYVVVTASEMTTNRWGVEGKYITIRESDSDEVLPKELFVVANNPAEILKVATEIERLRLKANIDKVTMGGKAWLPYYAYKNTNLLMEGVKFKGSEKDMASKSIDYGYAVTAHKSQGSTYTTVFVDEDSMDTNQYDDFRDRVKRTKRELTPRTKQDVDTERNKIKYVALSRPTTKAMVLSQKTGDMGNTHIDKPVIIAPDPNLPELPPGNAQEDAGDGTGDVLISYSRQTPNEIVSDSDVVAFMNRCK